MNGRETVRAENRATGTGEALSRSLQLGATCSPSTWSKVTAQTIKGTSYGECAFSSGPPAPLHLRGGHSVTGTGAARRSQAVGQELATKAAPCISKSTRSYSPPPLPRPSQTLHNPLRFCHGSPDLGDTSPPTPRGAPHCFSKLHSLPL